MPRGLIYYNLSMNSQRHKFLLEIMRKNQTLQAYLFVLEYVGI